jgi:Mlc titration factor MtfA (ptsG expression regulator)
MFAWWRQRRREKILETPFPEAWRSIIAKNVGYTKFLNQEEQKQLEDLVQVFIEEKTFVGCGGLELDDEVRVTVAANACILLLGLNHDVYAEVESILVYPSTVRPPERAESLAGTGTTLVAEGPAILGQAHLRGPVILVWDAVTHGSRYATNGYNVVFHEFAHKLDMLDSEIDGTPPLRNSEQYARWSKVCGEVYFDLQRRVKRRQRAFLDGYGATNEAEFFAVATEHFFEKPRDLKGQHPALYSVLQEYYRQDPAARVPVTPKVRRRAKGKTRR